MTTGALHEFQRAFRSMLLDDGGDPRDGDFAADGIAVAAAAAIYRNNVFGKLREALGEIYPVVERLVGDAFFSHMARQFVRRHPPRTPVLAEYGADLPDFLDRFPPAAQVPYLGDVARLELARQQAATAADASPLAPAGLKAVPPQRLGGIRLALHPSCRLLRSTHPVDAIWAAHQSGGEPGPIDFPRRETCLLVARPHAAVETMALAPVAFDLLAALRAGRTLTDAFAATGGGWDPEPALTALIAFGAFATFSEDMP